MTDKINWDEAPPGADFYDKSRNVFYRRSNGGYFRYDACIGWSPSGITSEDVREMEKRPAANEQQQGTKRDPDSKYHREIKPGVFVDVYDVLKAWEVINPALQHLIKKALAPGKRGHKDLVQDMDDIVASSIRARELES